MEKDNKKRKKNTKEKGVMGEWIPKPINKARKVEN